MTTAPNTPAHANEDHEALAGDPVDDGFPREETPTPGGEHKDRANAADNQTPEVVEFGARAVEAGGPDGEDRPNGDPETVGHPLGGGERSPEVTDGGSTPDDARTDQTREES